MDHTIGRRARALMLSALVAAALLPVRAASAVTTTVTYSFLGDEDGEYPSTDLILDDAGALYGTTVLGGDFGSGTIFRLARADSGWTKTILYSFTSGADGGQPYGGVTRD